jgi:hypothetical protein
LNPLKRKSLVEKTAQDLNCPVEAVDDLVLFFYQELQKKMSQCFHHSLWVPNLGTFVIKKKSLTDMINKHKYFIARLEKDEAISVRMYEAILQSQQQIKILTNMQEIMEEEESKKKDIKQKRKEYIDDKSDKNMEREG